MKLAMPLTLFALGAIAGGSAAFSLRPGASTRIEEAPDRERMLFRAERRTAPTSIRQDRLEKRLAELNRKLAKAQQRVASLSEANLEAARKPFDSLALMHYQREHDPAAYAQQTNSIIRHLIWQQESNEEDLALLRSVDASGWDPDERACFEEYVELADFITQYEAKLAQLRMLDPELPPGYGYDGMGGEILRKYELQCDVRYRLMAEAAKLYGLSEEDAMSLADVAHRVTECTLAYPELRKERERNEERHLRQAREAAETDGAAR